VGKKGMMRFFIIASTFPFPLILDGTQVVLFSWFLSLLLDNIEHLLPVSKDMFLKK
jgi:hypothetical protein